MKKQGPLFAALFFISVALIAYELDVMRVFTVSSWSSFGSMVISIALLGYGAAGTLLTFLQKRFRRNAAAWLQVTAICLGPVMALSYILAQQVPFNPVLLVSNWTQIFWIAVYYILYALPFFVGAMFIGIAFTVLAEGVHSLYFWNMAGSGIGGFIILGFMYVLPVRRCIIPILVLSAVGAFFIVFFRRPPAAENGGGSDGVQGISLSVRTPKQTAFGLVFAAAACIAAIVPVLLFGGLKPSQFKSVELAKVTFSDLELVHNEHSPLGQMEVYKSSQLHFAPGLSDNVIFYIDEMPRDAFWALYIDGNGPINMMRELTEEEKIYLDFLPMAAPYEVLENPSVFISHLGGGFSAFSALHHNAEEIVVVEPNTALISMMKEHPEIREFQGDLLHDPKIDILEQEPRAHASRSRGKYDLVEISLIDSLGLSQSVGNPLHENYTYTTEAMEDYISCLHPEGILSITTWNHLAPPRNVPKLLTTVIDSMRRQGIEDPGRHLYVFQLIYSTATVLVKKTPFTPEEIEKLNQFTYKMSFETIYHHGIEPREDNLREQLEAYTAKYDTNPENDVMGDEVSRPMGDLYYHIIDYMLEGREAEIYDAYLFDITPATDNRPYFTSYLKPDNIRMFLDKLDAVSEEWSYLLLVGTLLQSIFFGIIIIIIPAIGGHKSQLKGSGSKLGVILYYSLLGVAYMLVEIFFIQKLVFYLGNPVFSTSIVITSMLIISGVGSVSGSKMMKEPRRFILIAAGIVAAMMVFYMTVLPAVLEGSLGAPRIVKMVGAIVIIAPAAFFMGMFFPTGLNVLAKNRSEMLPWAWGMNGAFSVTGSLLARYLAVQFGFRILLLAALLVYAAAGLLFPVNLKKREKAAG
jgi:spermidine synthase